jgi:hypothetical protein
MVLAMLLVEWIMPSRILVCWSKYTCSRLVLLFSIISLQEQPAVPALAVLVSNLTML